MSTTDMKCYEVEYIDIFEERKQTPTQKLSKKVNLQHAHN